MSKKTLYQVQRAGGYILGLILFYAPFAVAQKLLIGAFQLTGRPDIHGSCFRMAISNVLAGKGLDAGTTTGLLMIAVLGAAFIFGPFFCGRLCWVGALPEYLSRLVPSRWQLDFAKWVDPAPVRFGMLAGFGLAPFLGLSVVCAYCNFSFGDRLIQATLTGTWGFLNSTAIVTGGVWLILFGLLNRGGRGFCTHLCPVGALQSLLHGLGAKLGFTYKLKLTREQCVSCGLCAQSCPTGALQNNSGSPEYHLLSCISCRQCQQACPRAAITYGPGTGWPRNGGTPMPKPLTEEVRS